MKKCIWLLLALLPLWGCEAEDLLPTPELANTKAQLEPGNPNRFFSFPSLSGEKGWGFI